MPSRSPLARRRIAPLAASGVLVVCAGLLAGGCLVSFDGYQLHGDAPSGGAGGKGGGSFAGSTSAAGDAGTGEAGDGGRSAGGDGGAAMAGTESGGRAGGSGSGGTAGTDNGGAAGSGGVEPKSCPAGLDGPPLIEVPEPSGGFYCMDRTEVTNQDYAAFLAANPSTAGQDPACAFNTTFEPDTTAACASEAVAQYDPVARPKVPVGCVDWCDAKRYCEWAGKRLCGAIGGGGNPPGSFADASASQWYRACSKGGMQAFPYGSEYRGTYCNGADVSGFHPAPVASLPACTGGYTGLFDMSGNVAEWEDSCSGNTGGSDDCLVRGGSIDSLEVNPPTLLCNSSTPNDATPSPASAKRSAKNELVGIRCCLDL